MGKLLGYDDDGNWIGPTGVDRAVWREEELKRMQLDAAKKNKIVAPADAYVPQMKRTLSDGVETVWIPGYSKSKYMIHGVASTPTINSHNYALLSRGCELKVPIPLLWEHAKLGDPIGQVLFIQRDEKKIYVRAAIFDHEAGRHVWKMIKRGEVSGFSGAAEKEDGTLHIQAEVDGVKFYDKWCLGEVSVCRTPANPDCRFEIYSPRGT